MVHWDCPECDVSAKTIEELRKKHQCRIEPLKMLDDEDHIENNINSKDKRNDSKKAYDFARNEIQKLVISANNRDDVFGIVESHNHLETINLASVRAVHWLQDGFMQKINSDDIHSPEFFKNIFHSITAHAQMNGTVREKAYPRIAQIKNNSEIWYDLGRPDWNMIKITSDKIETVKFDGNSPLFFRTQSLQEQVMPIYEKQSNALDKLLDLLHILPEQRLLFKIHLVCLFLENIPVPMIVFDGTAGSIKTSATAAVKMIVDPSGIGIADNVFTLSEKHDDLINQIDNRYLSSFDNVSNIDPKTSDILCRAITGSSNPKRKLYTNQEETIRSFRRKCVLNGVVPTLEYPDLQTRLITYAREVIDEKNRLTESVFKQNLAELMPLILGEIFVVLSKSIGVIQVHESKIKTKTRMSDFEMWGEIISQKMGYEPKEFLDCYYAKLKEENTSSQDAYPIIFAIQRLMNDKELYEDSTSNLYRKLRDLVEEDGIDVKSQYLRFPKAPNKLPKHFKVVDSFLMSAGFVVTSYHYTKNDGKFTKNASIIKITRKENQTTLDLGDYRKVSSPSSLSSPFENYEQKKGNIGEDNGEHSLVSSPESSPLENQKQNSSEDNGEHNTESSFVSSPKNNDSSHENNTGEHSEHSEDTFSTSSGADKEIKTHYMCFTCNKKGTEPFLLGVKTSNGLTEKDHDGHKILLLNEKELKEIHHYDTHGGLKPDVLRNMYKNNF